MNENKFKKDPPPLKCTFSVISGDETKTYVALGNKLQTKPVPEIAPQDRIDPRICYG